MKLPMFRILEVKVINVATGTMGFIQNHYLCKNIINWIKSYVLFTNSFNYISGNKLLKLFHL